MDNTAEKVWFGLAVVSVGFIHFATTFFLAFAAGVGSSHGAAAIASRILTFPLSLLKGPDNLPPLVGWGAWGLLSLLWGFGICTLIRFLQGAK